MNKDTAWLITLCIVAVMLWIPAWVYRWALVCLVVLPLTLVLLVFL